MRHFEKCNCKADPEKPLFIPLKGVHYDAFFLKAKNHEFRLYGPRWNERTCRPGRAVTLSRGYGKQQRMKGRVRDFSAISFYDLPTRWRRDILSCYGRKAGRSVIAVIGIEIQKAHKVIQIPAKVRQIEFFLQFQT